MEKRRIPLGYFSTASKNNMPYPSSHHRGIMCSKDHLDYLKGGVWDTTFHHQTNHPTNLPLTLDVFSLVVSLIIILYIIHVFKSFLEEFINTCERAIIYGLLFYRIYNCFLQCITSFRLRDNSVNLHECSPILVCVFFKI